MSGWLAVGDPGPALPGHGHIYCIRVDGRQRYVGQTKYSLTRRMGAHVAETFRLKSHKANGLRRAIADGRTVTIEPVHVNVEHGSVLDAYEVEAIANLMAVGDCWNTNSSATCIDFDNLSPESRAAMSDGLKAKWQDPEYAAKMRAKWQDPEHVAMHSAKMKAQWQDPEYAAMMSANTKAQWQDPEYAAKMEARWQDPEQIAMHSAKSKAQWQDPEYAAKQSASSKAQWQDPGRIAEQSAKMKARWQDPEFAAKMVASLEAGSRWRPGGAEPYPLGESPQDQNPNNIARKRLGQLWREFDDTFLGYGSVHRAAKQGLTKAAIGIPILALLDAGWSSEQVIAMGPDVRGAARLTA